MNYNHFIGYFFLLLLATYDCRNEDLEALKEEIRSTRQEVTLMRKELALAREAVARINAEVVPVKAATDIAEQADLVIE